MEKTAIVVNISKSSTGEKGQLFLKIWTLLLEKYPTWESVQVLTTENEEQVPQALKLIDAPQRLIVVGGDGTVRGVLEAARQTFKRKLPLFSVIPAGTMNLLGQEFNVPLTLLPNNLIIAPKKEYLLQKRMGRYLKKLFAKPIVSERPLMVVNGHPGFVFGWGIPSRFVRKWEFLGGRWYSIVLAFNLAWQSIISAGVLSIFDEQKASELILLDRPRKKKKRISIGRKKKSAEDDQPEAEEVRNDCSYNLVLASTISSLFFALRPAYQAKFLKDQFLVIRSDYHFYHYLARFIYIFFHLKFKSPHYLVNGSHHYHLIFENEEEWMLDGEFFASKEIDISIDGEISFFHL